MVRALTVGEKNRRCHMRIKKGLVALTIALTIVTPAQAGQKTAQRNRAIYHEEFPNVKGNKWDCVNTLFSRESGWQNRARNGHHYGIPQSYRPNMTEAEVQKYLDNPRRQVKDGMRYIRYRYGGTCAAKAHSDSHGWY